VAVPDEQINRLQRQIESLQQRVQRIDDETLLRTRGDLYESSLVDRQLGSHDDEVASLQLQVDALDTRVSDLEGMDLREVHIGDLPAPSSTYHGVLWLVPGGADEADRFYVCIQLIDDSYEWKQVSLEGVAYYLFEGGAENTVEVTAEGGGTKV